MPVTVQIDPIVAGRLDEWRRFVDELTGIRRVDWAQSHRRRGVTRVVISLAGTEEAPLSVVLVEASDPKAADELLRASDDPFDVWLRQSLVDLLEPAIPATVLFDSAPRRGPWRGMRPLSGRP
jgi:hypothetical protein